MAGDTASQVLQLTDVCIIKCAKYNTSQVHACRLFIRIPSDHQSLSSEVRCAEIRASVLEGTQSRAAVIMYDATRLGIRNPHMNILKVAAVDINFHQCLCQLHNSPITYIRILRGISPSPKKQRNFTKRNGNLDEHVICLLCEFISLWKLWSLTILILSVDDQRACIYKRNNLHKNPLLRYVLELMR